MQASSWQKGPAAPFPRQRTQDCNLESSQFSTGAQHHRPQAPQAPHHHPPLTADTISNPTHLPTHHVIAQAALDKKLLLTQHAVSDKENIPRLILSHLLAGHPSIARPPDPPDCQSIHPPTPSRRLSCLNPAPSIASHLHRGRTRPVCQLLAPVAYIHPSWATAAAPELPSRI